MSKRRATEEDVKVIMSAVQRRINFAWIINSLEERGCKHEAEQIRLAETTLEGLIDILFNVDISELGESK